MVSTRLSSADSDSMAVRAAWLHYAGGYTQAEVAKKLGISSLKVHRLVTRANKSGMIKVFIDSELAECVALEDRLSALYGLEYCEVVPDLAEDGLPLQALAVAGAQYLKRVIENKDCPTIGVGHGRTLAACVRALPSSPAVNKTIVSLLGGFSKKFSANPHDVIHRLAERTGANAFVMPVPFHANSIEDKAIILKQHGISEVLELALNTSVKIVGIGSIHFDASIVTNVMVEGAELQEAREAGVVAELLGHFFDEDGVLVKTALSERTMGLTSEELLESKFFAIAGGESKVQAISAILKSGLLNGLLVDERSARSLVGIGGEASVA